MMPTGPGWWWRQGKVSLYVSRIEMCMDGKLRTEIGGTEVIADGKWLAPIPGPEVCAAVAELDQAIEASDTADMATIHRRGNAWVNMAAALRSDRKAAP